MLYMLLAHRHAWSKYENIGCFFPMSMVSTWYIQSPPSVRYGEQPLFVFYGTGSNTDFFYETQGVSNKKGIHPSVLEAVE